jgi:hypothetical protein
LAKEILQRNDMTKIKNIDKTLETEQNEH